MVRGCGTKGDEGKEGGLAAAGRVRQGSDGAPRRLQLKQTNTAVT